MTTTSRRIRTLVLLVLAIVVAFYYVRHRRTPATPSESRTQPRRRDHLDGARRARDVQSLREPGVSDASHQPADSGPAGAHQPDDGSGRAVARLELDDQRRRAHRYARPAAWRHVVRRRALHGRRRGVLVRGGGRRRRGQRDDRPGQRGRPADRHPRRWPRARRPHLGAAVCAGRAAAGRAADLPEARARSGLEGRQIRRGLGPEDTAGGDPLSRSVRAWLLHAGPAGRAAIATRATGVEMRAARRCRTSIASRWRSSRTATPRRCGSYRGRSICCRTRFARTTTAR